MLLDVSAPSGQYANPMQDCIHLTDSICADSAFTFETLIKEPKTGPSFTGFGDTYSFWMAIASDSDDPSFNFYYANPEDTNARLIITNLTGVSGGTSPSFPLPGNFNNFRKLTIQITNDKYKIYLDTQYIGEAPHPPIHKFREFYFQPLANSFQSDWIHILDKNNNLILDEEFNDCAHMAHFTGNACAPNCESTFTGYYNNKYATTLTFNDIKALHASQCNDTCLNVCSACTPSPVNNAPAKCITCDSLQALVDAYFITQATDAGSETGMLSFMKTQLGNRQYYFTTQQIQQVLTNCNNSYQKNLAYRYRGANALTFRYKAPLCINTDFTLEGWVYTESASADKQTIAYNANTNFADAGQLWKNGFYGYRIFIADGKVQFMMGVGGADINHGGIVWIRTTSTLSLKKWHHIAVERIGNSTSNFKIYIDGQLQNTEIAEGTGTLNSGDVCYSETENNQWSIGNGSFSGNNVYPIQGMLKNIRMYKKALSQSVVLANYNCTGVPTDTTSMVLWAKMDEGSGAMLDYSNYHNQSEYITIGSGSAVTSWSGGGGPAVNPGCLPNGVLLCNAAQPVPTLYLCGKSEPVFPPAGPDSIDNCSDSAFLIVSTATELYKAYTDSIRNNFDTAYRSKCMQAYKYETFTVTHQVSEYHYTLYYYDQAGNLVKTVPPAGVNANRDDTWLEQVRVERNKGDLGQRIVPAHTLITNYRYNTLNQVVGQSTPDAGESKFWYDRLGRLALSQNAKQKAVSSKVYSYTKYDVLGRIGEVGEITGADTMSAATSRRQDYLDQWLSNAASSRTQITQTNYDRQNWALQPGLNAQNLRNRVAGTFYYNTAADLPAATYQSATYYSYDIHGNVDTLLQDYKGLAVINTANRFKKLVYRYDLISGKVNSVAYQPGQRDAFYHRYSYDAENRITNVETSRDSLYWEKEAYYEYYKHGPLARTVLGQNQVQGMDYAYTLQGWLKGVNTTFIRPDNYSNDMGGDGIPASNVARDAVGFSLYYYPTSDNGFRDYRPLVNTYAIAGWGYVEGIKPLYNGNIASVSMHIPKLGDPQMYMYSYDQLNRLRGMTMVNREDGDMFTVSGNDWTYPQTRKDFKESITYDANGNILTYNRNGNTKAGKPLGMDSLTYHYTAGTNKLDYISDAVNRNNYTEDIDNQNPHNYTYDAIGNLVKDNAEGISNIDWTVYGKIKKITKTDGSVIQYSYDPSGNRINKSVTSAGTTKQTFYVRDAQGNVMTVYQNGTDSLNAGRLTQTELDIYGSSRLGMLHTTADVESNYVRTITALPVLNTVGYDTAFTRGAKQYELTNHLGNVLVTVSDKKKAIRSAADTTAIDHYEADVITATDYYPFGMVMPGRSKYLSEIADVKTLQTCTSCGTLQQLMNDYFSTLYQSVGSETDMISYIQSRLLADSLSYTTAEITTALNTCGNSWKKNIALHADIGPFVAYENSPQVRFHKENFSIEAWIYPETQNTDVQTIVMNHNLLYGGMAGYRLYLLDGRVYLQMGDLSASLSDSGCAQVRMVNTISSNDWHHVVAVRNGNNAANFKIYIDGVLQATEVANYPAMKVSGGDVYNEYGNRYCDRQWQRQRLLLQQLHWLHQQCEGI